MKLLLGFMKACVSLAFPFVFTLCFLANAESTKDIVDMVLKGESLTTTISQDVLIDSIQACPVDEAVTLFLAAYKDGDDTTQSRAIYGLTLLPPADVVTEAILGCAMSGKKTARQALYRLDNRTLSRRLSIAESGMFADAVQKDDTSGNAAWKWARLGPADTEMASEIITKRFISEINNPLLGESHVKGIVTSPRVFYLNQYLLAYENLGESAQPVLCKELAIAGNDEVSTWLTMALAVSGDSEAGLSLKQSVCDVEASPSIRVCAIHCYTMALGEEARPLLTELLNDQAVTDYPEGADEYIHGEERNNVVAIAARDNLWVLDHPELYPAPKAAF